MQVARNRRQSDVGDRAIEHRQNEAKRDGQDSPIPIGRRETIEFQGCTPALRHQAATLDGNSFRTVSTSSDARSGRLTMRTSGPRGAHSAGSESYENSTTDGQPAVPSRCIGPV